MKNLKNYLGKALGIAGIVGVSFLPMKSYGQGSEKIAKLLSKNYKQNMEILAYGHVAKKGLDSAIIMLDKMDTTNVLQSLESSNKYLNCSLNALYLIRSKKPKDLIYKDEDVIIEGSSEAPIDSIEAEDLLLALAEIYYFQEELINKYKNHEKRQKEKNSEEIPDWWKKSPAWAVTLQGGALSKKLMPKYEKATELMVKYFYN